MTSLKAHAAMVRAEEALQEACEELADVDQPSDHIRQSLTTLLFAGRGIRRAMGYTHKDMWGHSASHAAREARVKPARGPAPSQERWTAADARDLLGYDPNQLDVA